MSQRMAAFGGRMANERAGVIDITGEVTAQAEAALMDAYTRATGASTRAVVLNFSGLEYLNSGGIGMLITLLVRANRQGRRLLAYGLSIYYRQIFQVTRLDEAIEIYDDEPAALAAVAAAP